MNSSIESSDNPSRINDLEVQKNTDGTVDVVVYWNKINMLDRKDTSNRRWLRRQLKRIVENIETRCKDTSVRFVYRYHYHYLSER